MPEKKRGRGLGWWPAIILGTLLAATILATAGYNVSRITAPPNAPPVSD